MPALTSAQIKNFVRRSFREIVDPSPSKKAIPSIWAYFQDRCAYCDKLLVKLNKEGHIDHLISASKHGKNHISNRVLACANCNEKEKLDQDWKIFLLQKAVEPDVYLRRKNTIDRWIEMHSENGRLLVDENQIALAREYAEKVNQVYEEYMRELKKTVRPQKR